METSEAAKQLGKRGGQSTFQKYGKDYFKELQRKSLEAKLLKKRADLASNWSDSTSNTAE